MEMAARKRNIIIYRNETQRTTHKAITNMGNDRYKAFLSIFNRKTKIVDCLRFTGTVGAIDPSINGDL